MGAVIEAKGIVNRFGAQTVHDGVGLVLEKGETLGLVGGSGSGKSVLLRTLLGLNKPAAGRVLVHGRDIYALPEDELKEIQKGWGVLFQDGALFSALSILDNVALPLREHERLSRDEIESLSLFKLRMVGLSPEAAAKFPSELSGGMTRRAALARALILDPPLLFLDEPTAGLDPVAANDFDALLLKLQEIFDLSVLMVTHDLDSLAALCDRVALLADKKIVTGTLQDMARSRDPKVHGYFSGPRMHNVVSIKPS